MWRAAGLFFVAAAILATAAAGAASGLGSEGAGASKVRVIISEQGRYVPLVHGKFVLEGAAGRDSGTSKISVVVRPPRIRDGQSFESVNASEFLTGKQGELNLAWTSIRVHVSTDVYILYGTWRVLAGFGTGMYKDWKGGGRFAATGSGNRYSIRFEGLVTR